MCVLALVLTGVLVTATAVSAHDFWVVPDAFGVAAGRAMTIRTVTGTKFPTSESAVAPERIAEARILAADASGDEPLRDYAVSGKSLVIQHRPAGDGERVIAVALAPTTRRMTADAFARYLRLEGAADLADRFLRDGPLPQDSVAMRSTKYAKTLVTVGTSGPRAFTRAAGHPLELVPLDDPLSMRPGETLAVRVLANGHAVTNAVVHAGRAADAGEVATPDLTLTTDANGVIRLPVTRAGLWNIRTAYAGPASGAASAPVTWDVWWATFVFSTFGAPSSQGGTIAPARAAAPTAGNDSTDVVRIVDEFRTALARGDSAAVLAVLAPDVLVLESGDVERLADYRRHHLASDIAFARAVPLTHTLVSARVEGNVAWATSTSIAQGQYNGRTVNSAGVELMILTRQAPGTPWTVRAIHWSSHRRGQ